MVSGLKALEGVGVYRVPSCVGIFVLRDSGFPPAHIPLSDALQTIPVERGRCKAIPSSCQDLGFRASGKI